MLFRPDAVSRINSIRRLSKFNSAISDTVLDQIYKKNGSNLLLQFIRAGFNPFRYFHSDDFYQCRRFELSMRLKWIITNIDHNHPIFQRRCSKFHHIFSEFENDIMPMSYRKYRKFEKHE